MIKYKGERGDALCIYDYINLLSLLSSRKWITQEDCSDFILDIPKWVELGVKYVGGCCRNDAGRISKIRKFIDQHYDLDRKEI